MAGFFLILRPKVRFAREKAGSVATHVGTRREPEKVLAKHCGCSLDLDGSGYKQFLLNDLYSHFASVFGRPFGQKLPGIEGLAQLEGTIETLCVAGDSRILGHTFYAQAADCLDAEK